MIYKYGVKDKMALLPPTDGIMYMDDGDKGHGYYYHLYYRRKLTDAEELEYKLQYVGEVQE